MEQRRTAGGLCALAAATALMTGCCGGTSCTVATSRPAHNAHKWSSDPAAAKYAVPDCRRDRNAAGEGWCGGVEPALSEDGFSAAPMSEKEMGAAGHFNGVMPLHYDIEWHFDEIVRRPGNGPIVDYRFPRQFAGNVHMVFKVTKPGTSSVFIHRSPPAIDLQYGRLRLRSFCGSADRLPCIRRLNSVGIDPEQHLGSEKHSDIVQFELDAELAVGGVYVLEMPFSANRFGFKAGIYYVQSRQGDMAVSSLFQMRYGRMAAPMVDQPALKATFDVSVRHPANYTALGCTPVTGIRRTAAGLLVTAFERTMPLPTYVLTFALYDASYASAGRFDRSLSQAAESDAAALPTGLVYYESDGVSMEQLGWILKQSGDDFRRMGEIARMPTVLDKVDYFVTDTPYWGIENMGMIGLGQSQMKRADDPLGRTTLTHEVIHQWVGNVFTVDHWDIICLQEGLTMYLEWVMSNETGLLPIDAVARSTAGAAFLLEGFSKPIVRPYLMTQQIADDCFKRPPVYFHMIGEAFGHDVWFRFTEKMAHRFKFDSAGMADWLEVLDEASGSAIPGKMLESFMTKPGFPLIGAYMSGDKMQLKQYQKVNREVQENPDTPFILPILYTDDKNQNALVILDDFESLSAIVPQPAEEPSWWLLNRKSTSYIEVVYDIKHYRSIMSSCYAGDYGRKEGGFACALDLRELQAVFTGLCRGISDGVQPVNGAETADDWLAFADELAVMALSSPELDPFGFGPPPDTVVIEQGCTCCLMDKEAIVALGGEPELAFDEGCGYIWNTQCRGTKMAKLLGRNFKIVGGNGEPLSAVEDA